MSQDSQIKQRFFHGLSQFASSLDDHVSTDDGQWRIKGFIDVCRNIYTISWDTKIVSKILEIHLFPQILDFAEGTGYRVVLAEHQNYYPDISFVHADDESIKFAVDFKTTYRLPDNPEFCNGFTLGSHGEYFINRSSSKNIQFPYVSAWALSTADMQREHWMRLPLTGLRAPLDCFRHKGFSVLRSREVENRKRQKRQWEYRQYWKHKQDL